MLSWVGWVSAPMNLTPQLFFSPRRYFGLPAQVECRVADGFDYLLATRRKFDAIVVDAFHGGRIASDLLSEAFFAQAAKRLRAGGAPFAHFHRPSATDSMPKPRTHLLSAAS